MNLTGEKVLHKRFGAGTIVQHNESSIKVLFESSNEIMQLSALVELNICNYLTFINPKTEALVKRAYEKIEEQKKIESQGLRINNFIQRNAKMPQFTTVEDFCNTFESEIMSEIRYLQKNKANRYQITDGELIATHAEQYTYVFEMDFDISLVDGTEITLYCLQQEYYASIISCHDYTIMFSTRSDIGNKIQEMEFSVESWKLLEALINHLTSISNNPSNIVTQLVCNCKTALEMEGTIATSAKTAIKTASSQPITFIWGPPGTGKTETLAEIVLKHIRNGKRVLMLAHSNVSVDGAILRIYKKSLKFVPRSYC